MKRGVILIFFFISFTFFSALAFTSERWAIIVGIDKFKSPEVNPLEGCVNDASAIKDTLLETYKFKNTNIFFLINRTATKKIFKEYLTG